MGGEEGGVKEPDIKSDEDRDQTGESYDEHAEDKAISGGKPRKSIRRTRKAAENQRTPLPQSGPAGWLLRPLSILRESIQAVPANAYALGVLGIVAAAAASIALTGGNWMIAVAGGVTVFTGMVVLRIFAQPGSSTRSKREVKPSPQVTFLTWICIFAFTVTLVFLIAKFYTELFKGARQADGGPQRAQPQPREQDHGDLTVHMQLDPLKTSLRCQKKNFDSNNKTQNLLDLNNCDHFSISNEQMGRFLGANLPVQEREFATNYEIKNLIPVFDALIELAKHRRTLPESQDASVRTVMSYVYNFREMVFDMDKRQEFLELKILPKNTEEWDWLDKNHPKETHALRTFIVEWFGVFDPCFRVVFKNTTGEDIVVSQITYNAEDIDTALAELMGCNVAPRYLLQLEAGKHDETISPPIIVPRHSTQSIDLVITLKQKRAGAYYNITLEYLSNDNKYKVTMPSFSVIFWEGKFDKKRH